MRILLFDIDGTLITTGGAGRAALEWALQTAFDRSGTEQVSVEGRTDAGICQQLFEQHQIPDTEANRRAFREAYLEALPECLERRQGAVLPGVEDLLGRLAEEPLHLGLLTGNVEHGARIKLKHYGLDHFFAFGGFGDRHPERNRVAREALESVQRRLGPAATGDRICVIGDTPLDVRCARAIGAKAIAVCTGGPSREALAGENPDLLLDDFRSQDAWWDRVLP